MTERRPSFKDIVTYRGLRDEKQRVLDLMIGFIGTSLQLQFIMTVQYMTVYDSFILCWTTSVFSSTVTNDEWRITAHKLSCLERRLSDESLLRMNYDSVITSRWPENRSPYRTVPLLLCSLSRESVLATCYPPMTRSLIFVAAGTGVYRSVAQKIVIFRPNIIVEFATSHDRRTLNRKSKFPQHICQKPSINSEEG
jgi:hypothetical protein